MIKKIDKGYSFSLGKKVADHVSLFLGLFIILILILHPFFSWLYCFLSLIFLVSGLTLSFGKEYLYHLLNEVTVKKIVLFFFMRKRKLNTLDIMKIEMGSSNENSASKKSLYYLVFKFINKPNMYFGFALTPLERKWLMGEFYEIKNKPRSKN